MPYLYRHVRLNVQHLTSKLSDVFGADHPGLPYIRILRIKGFGMTLTQDDVHLAVICHLLTVIPKNSLRIFESVGPVH